MNLLFKLFTILYAQNNLLNAKFIIKYKYNH